MCEAAWRSVRAYCYGISHSNRAWTECWLTGSRYFRKCLWIWLFTWRKWRIHRNPSWASERFRAVIIVINIKSFTKKVYSWICYFLARRNCRWVCCTVNFTIASSWAISCVAAIVAPKPYINTNIWAIVWNILRVLIYCDVIFNVRIAGRKSAWCSQNFTSFIKCVIISNIKIQTKRKDLIYAKNVHDTPDFSNTKH